MTMRRRSADVPVPPVVLANRARQVELYGELLGDRVRRLTATLGVSQARLARTIGISPAMLSQLASARRVKIGDPAVLARMLLIEQRCAAACGRLERRSVDVLLADVARTQWGWVPVLGTQPAARQLGLPPLPDRTDPRPPPSGGTAAEVLRRIAAPARLAAAAAALGPGFPELAEVLRQAAGRPGG